MEKNQTKLKGGRKSVFSSFSLFFFSITLLTYKSIELLNIRASRDHEILKPLSFLVLLTIHILIEH